MYLEDSGSEEAEAEIYHENVEDTNSSVGEDLEEDIITDEIRAIMDRSEEEGGVEEDQDTNPSAGMTEEEIEAQLKEEEAIREEEERLAKKQKVSTNYGYFESVWSKILSRVYKNV